MLLSGFPMGSVLAAKAYAWVVPRSSWRVLFCLGVIPVALAVYLRRRLPEAREWREERGRDGAPAGRSPAAAER